MDGPCFAHSGNAMNRRLLYQYGLLLPTPNTEAPREMNTFIPEMKALWMAENVIASLRNSIRCAARRCATY
jgi:alkyl sulfatase BDS1-like metallo-beta-lactamase superfamily hydrolase